MLFRLPFATQCILVLFVLCSVAQGDQGVYPLLTPGKQGSCVAIESRGDDRQHFLTVEHADGNGNGINVNVNGTLYPCERVTGWTGIPEPISLIRAKTAIKGVRTYSIAPGSQQPGDVVYSVGFQFGRYRGVKTKVKRVERSHGGYYVLDGIMNSGSSGGAVLNESGRLVALIQSVHDGSRETLAVSVRDATNGFADGRLVQWICTPNGCIPQYRVDSRVRVRERGSVGILGRSYVREYIPPPATPQPQQPIPRPQPPPQQGTVIQNACVVDYDKLAALFMQQYGDQLRGEDGLPGVNGNDGRPGANGRDGETPKIDMDELANAITLKYADRIRGEQGQRGSDGMRGPQGERGLIGVPSEEELAAVIDLWVSRNGDMINQYIVDASESQINALVARIEALENRQPSGDAVDLTTINKRITSLEERKFFVAIGDGKRKQLLDADRYTGREDDPIIIDINKLMDSIREAQTESGQ